MAGIFDCHPLQRGAPALPARGLGREGGGYGVPLVGLGKPRLAIRPESPDGTLLRAWFRLIDHIRIRRGRAGEDTVNPRLEQRGGMCRVRQSELQPS